MYDSIGRPLSFISQGSFEANPPFVEEVMERMVDHIHSLLKVRGSTRYRNYRSFKYYIAFSM